MPHYTQTHWGIITRIHVHTITSTHKQPHGIGSPWLFPSWDSLFKSRKPLASASRLSPFTQLFLPREKSLRKMSQNKLKVKNWSLWVDWHKCSSMWCAWEHMIYSTYLCEWMHWNVELSISFLLLCFILRFLLLHTSWWKTKTHVTSQLFSSLLEKWEDLRMLTDSGPLPWSGCWPLTSEEFWLQTTRKPYTGVLPVPAWGISLILL